MKNLILGGKIRLIMKMKKTKIKPHKEQFMMTNALK